MDDQLTNMVKKRSDFILGLADDIWSRRVEMMKLQRAGVNNGGTVKYVPEMFFDSKIVSCFDKKVLQELDDLFTQALVRGGFTKSYIIEGIWSMEFKLQ